MKAPGKIIVGGIVTVIVLSFLLGISNMMMLFLGSIVCTMGFGLAFWLPVFWLVGTVIVNLPFLNFVVTKASVTEEAVSEEINPNEAALRNYVHNAKIKGFTLENITATLTKAGWQDKDIAKALASY